jgi:hypothetical protein
MGWRRAAALFKKKRIIFLEKAGVGKKDVEKGRRALKSGDRRLHGASGKVARFFHGYFHRAVFHREVFLFHRKCWKTPPLTAWS